MRLGALGGSLTGSASLENLDRFRLSGNLHNFDIDQLARAFLAKPLGYDGVVSGPLQLEGSLKNPAAVVAHAGLGIAPGKRGEVPIRAATVRERLPASRMDLTLTSKLRTLSIAPGKRGVPVSGKLTVDRSEEHTSELQSLRH